MNIIWTLLLLALGTGSGAAPQEQATGNEAIQADTMWASVAHTFKVNLAEGRLDNPIKPSELKVNPQVDAPKVKGIYVTAYSAGGSRMDQLVDLVDQTELNAMVIDIKDDLGYITYKTDNPELNKWGNRSRSSVTSMR